MKTRRSTLTDYNMKKKKTLISGISNMHCVLGKVCVFSAEEIEKGSTCNKATLLKKVLQNTLTRK